MKGVRQEKESLGGLLSKSVAVLNENGYVSEKDLKRRLKIAAPTAVKLIAAMLVGGYIGAESQKGRFVPGRGREFAKDAEYPASYDYIPLVESDKDFGRYGLSGYLTGLLLPAVKLGLSYKSLSVVFIERKLGVVRERARELFDLITAAGMLGGEDPLNPGRRLMVFRPADYDRAADAAEALHDHRNA